MSSSSPASPFELCGEYYGFIRTFLGKKRLVLRMGREETFLKVPKELRRHLQATLATGTAITVLGHEVMDEEHQRPKRVVVDIRLTDDGKSLACELCPIQVCAKKNCWRQGGQELWHALEGEIARRAVSDSVHLKEVHCLDHCKHAPNAEWLGHEFHRCTSADAGKIVATALGEDARARRHG
jgi:hypothetical protein